MSRARSIRDEIENDEVWNILTQRYNKLSTVKADKRSVYDPHLNVVVREETARKRENCENYPEILKGSLIPSTRIVQIEDEKYLGIIWSEKYQRYFPSYRKQSAGARRAELQAEIVWYPKFQKFVPKLSQEECRYFQVDYSASENIYVEQHAQVEEPRSLSPEEKEVLGTLVPADNPPRPKPRKRQVENEELDALDIDRGVAAWKRPEERDKDLQSPREEQEEERKSEEKVERKEERSGGAEVRQATPPDDTITPGSERRRVDLLSWDAGFDYHLPPPLTDRRRTPPKEIQLPDTPDTGEDQPGTETATNAPEQLPRRKTQFYQNILKRVKAEKTKKGEQWEGFTKEAERLKEEEERSRWNIGPTGEEEGTLIETQGAEAGEDSLRPSRSQVVRGLDKEFSRESEAESSGGFLELPTKEKKIEENAEEKAEEQPQTQHSELETTEHGAVGGQSEDIRNKVERPESSSTTETGVINKKVETPVTVGNRPQRHLQSYTSYGQFDANATHVSPSVYPPRVRVSSAVYGTSTPLLQPRTFIGQRGQGPWGVSPVYSGGVDFLAQRNLPPWDPNQSYYPDLVWNQTLNFPAVTEEERLAAEERERLLQDLSRGGIEGVVRRKDRQISTTLHDTETGGQYLVEDRRQQIQGQLPVSPESDSLGSVGREIDQVVNEVIGEDSSEEVLSQHSLAEEEDRERSFRPLVESGSEENKEETNKRPREQSRQEQSQEEPREEREREEDTPRTQHQSVRHVSRQEERESQQQREQFESRRQEQEERRRRYLQYLAGIAEREGERRRQWERQLSTPEEENRYPERATGNTSQTQVKDTNPNTQNIQRELGHQISRSEAQGILVNREAQRRREQRVLQGPEVGFYSEQPEASMYNRQRTSIGSNSAFTRPVGNRGRRTPVRGTGRGYPRAMERDPASILTGESQPGVSGGMPPPPPYSRHATSQPQTLANASPVTVGVCAHGHADFWDCAQCRWAMAEELEEQRMRQLREEDERQNRARRNSEERRGGGTPHRGTQARQDPVVGAGGQRHPPRREGTRREGYFTPPGGDWRWNEYGMNGDDMIDITLPQRTAVARDNLAIKDVPKFYGNKHSEDVGNFILELVSKMGYKGRDPERRDPTDAEGIREDVTQAVQILGVSCCGDAQLWYSNNVNLQSVLEFRNQQGQIDPVAGWRDVLQRLRNKFNKYGESIAEQSTAWENLGRNPTFPDMKSFAIALKHMSLNLGKKLEEAKVKFCLVYGGEYMPLFITCKDFDDMIGVVTSQSALPMRGGPAALAPLSQLQQPVQPVQPVTPATTATVPAPQPGATAATAAEPPAIGFFRAFAKRMDRIEDNLDRFQAMSIQDDEQYCEDEEMIMAMRDEESGSGRRPPFNNRFQRSRPSFGNQGTGFTRKEGQPTGSLGPSSGQIVCDACKELGHTWMNCPKMEYWEKKVFAREKERQRQFRQNFRQNLQGYINERRGGYQRRDGRDGRSPGRGNWSGGNWSGSRPRNYDQNRGQFRRNDQRQFNPRRPQAQGQKTSGGDSKTEDLTEEKVRALFYQIREEEEQEQEEDPEDILEDQIMDDIISGDLEN